MLLGVPGESPGFGLRIGAVGCGVAGRSGAFGLGPPYRVIQSSCGIASRPDIVSGYNATTLAGLISRSRNALTASSYLAFRKLSTA